MKFISLLFFAVSSLFAQIPEPIRTVHGPNLSIRINSDTTFFITNEKAIHFSFIDEELYKTQRSIYEKSVLNDAQCTDIDDFQQCKSIIANRRLTQYREKFSKSNSCIMFHLESSKSRSLCDRICNCDIAVHYEVKDYLIGFNLFSVLAVNFRDSDYKLIDSGSGKLITIWGEPFPSPQSKRVITYSYDPGIINQPRRLNGLQMWQKTNDKIELEWHMDLKKENWGIRELFWADDDTIYLKSKPRLFRNSIKNPVKRKFLKLTLKD